MSKLAGARSSRETATDRERVRERERERDGNLQRDKEG